MTTVLYMPDGHRRYAVEKGVSLEESYYMGGKVLETLARFFLLEGRADNLIFHAMSDYTFSRDLKNLDVIKKTATRLFNEWADKEYFASNGIGINIIDNAGIMLPDELHQAMKRLEDASPIDAILNIDILLGYSLAADMEHGIQSGILLHWQEVKEHSLFPDIDLVIRTMEMRLSGGPVYAMSQAQMMTIDKLNPAVDYADLEVLWEEFNQLRNRRLAVNRLQLEPL